MHKQALKRQLALYLITDRHCLNGKDLEASVAAALAAGVSCLQYREKHLSDEEKLQQALKLKELAALHQVPFIINDSVDLALAADADGVHIGQKDISVTEARARLGAEKIIGATARTVAQAIKAQQEGADYIGCGAAFDTETKLDTEVIGRAGIQQICAAVAIPVVAIGGIQQGNIVELKETGISGVAVASGILGNERPEAAASALFEAVRQNLILKAGDLE